VRFLVHSQQGTVFLTADGITLSSGTSNKSVHIRLAPTPRATPVGELRTGGFSNYYRGSQTGWIRRIPLFERVRYANAYPGIDVVVHARQQNLEVDFEVDPGASVGDLVFALQGADQICIAGDGSLLVDAGSQSWRLPAPSAYQIRYGHKQSVKIFYRRLTGDLVAIGVDQFDRNSKLVIDPVVEYSFIRTYGNSNVSAMQVDADGNLIFAGTGSSKSYPVVNGQPPNPSGSEQIFVTKLNGATKAVMFSTYLPASDTTLLSGMTLDPQGNIYLTGAANSNDFPVTSTNLGSCSSFCNT
jgi:hypothetical protein